MGIFKNEPDEPTPAPVTASAAPVRYSQPRAIVASASRLRLQNRKTAEEIRLRNSMSQAWQEQSWRCFDKVGEVQFAYNLVSDALSRLRVHAAVMVNPDAPPVEITDAIMVKASNDETIGTPGGVSPQVGMKAREIMAQFNSCGIANMLKTFALNILMPGECYLACIDAKWSIKSTSEIRVDPAGDIKLYPSAATQSAPRPLPKATPIGRIWQQHPRFSQDANSAMRSVIDDCEELVLLSRMIRGTTRSRLNAGILFVPDTISAAARTPGAEDTGDPDDLDGTQQEVDPFEQELVVAMSEPVSDETSMSSVVPLLVRGPAEQGQYIKKIDMGREADQTLVERADKVLVRILNGLNAPKDKVTGYANIKYSNARAIDDNMYKEHVEPLALIFVDAITDIYLRPMLVAAAAVDEDFPEEDIEKIIVWYDPSEIVTRPDRGADADAGHERNTISDSAWRAAHGFGDSDAPTEEEMARRTAYRNIPPPEILQVLFEQAFPDILASARKQSLEQNPIPPDLQNALDDTTAVTPAEPVEPSLGGPDASATAPAAPAHGTGGEPTAMSQEAPVAV